MAKPIRVVFLTFYYEGWDALEGVYQRMLDDERFDPIVVVIPRWLTGYTAFTDIDRIDAFFTDRGIDHLVFDFPDGTEGLAQLEQMSPDYIFINYPWQRNYQPAYRVVNLVGFTKVCYVPYFSSSLVQEPGVDGVAPHQYIQATHQLAHMVFLQDTDTKEAFDQAGRASQAFLTGTPKIDAFIQARDTEQPWWPLERPETTFKLIWAPHHSFDDQWLNFGHFMDQYEHLLRFAQDNPTVDIVFRPHPYLLSTLIVEKLISEEALAAWRQRWDELPNTFTDENAPMVPLLLASDAMLTDGVSFIGEYPVITGKPAIFWEKDQHWAFSRIGERAAETAIRVHSWDEVSHALSQAQHGALPSRKKEIASYISELRPTQTSAAEAIVELVLDDYAATP
jgi:hypothetical protein